MKSPSYPADWLEIRLQQLSLDGNRCRGCGIAAAQLAELGWAPLQVHHINEGPPAYAGPYHREVVGQNLLTLCPDCHDGITDSVRRQRFRLDEHKRVDRPDLQRLESAHHITRKPHGIPAIDQGNIQREEHPAPQRSNRRSAQRLLQGLESDQRQAQEDGR